jgi:hypothetical protein
MIISLPALSYTANILSFFVTAPIAAASWYQALRARQEVRRSRDLVIHSENCLEFVSADGHCVNLVPLETLHNLPRPGDVVLLPGQGVASPVAGTGAWRIERVEHIYTQSTQKSARPQEARLTKTMAYVVSLHDRAALAIAGDLRSLG